MYTIHTDVAISRRKRLNHVADENGTVVFSAGHVFKCFEHLLDKAEFTFYLEHEGARMRCMIGRDNG